MEREGGGGAREVETRAGRAETSYSDWGRTDESGSVLERGQAYWSESRTGTEGD